MLGGRRSKNFAKPRQSGDNCCGEQVQNQLIPRPLSLGAVPFGEALCHDVRRGLGMIFFIPPVMALPHLAASFAKAIDFLPYEFNEYLAVCWQVDGVR